MVGTLMPREFTPSRESTAIASKPLESSSRTDMDLRAGQRLFESLDELVGAGSEHDSLSYPNCRELMNIVILQVGVSELTSQDLPGSGLWQLPGELYSPRLLVVCQFLCA